MTDKNLSKEELDRQKRMFKSAERIAMVIHHNPQDLFESEEAALRNNPQLNAMVETLLSIMVAKAKGYHGCASASWEISDKNCIRNGTLQVNDSFSEGVLEIKEYSNDTYHLYSQTIGIHEMVFKRTLKASSAEELLVEVHKYLKQYGCPENELQHFHEKV